MIINTEKLQEVSKKIIDAVDTENKDKFNENLELKSEGNKLVMNVTNREYYVSVSIDLDNDVEDFRAVVSAPLFLSLIAKTTTKDVELTKDDSTLVVKGNGKYNLPMIYDVTDLVALPKIEIENVTASFTIDSEVLSSIATFNSKEVNTNSASKPSQKLYYLDEKGCFTYSSSGACVNSFNLSTPIKIALTSKLVKLFKLFKGGDVNFSLGYDQNGSTLQTKVKFERGNVVIAAIISSDVSLINTFPVEQFRKAALVDFPYNATFKRTNLIEAINRLVLFSSSSMSTVVGEFTFDSTGVTISDIKKENVEYIGYDNTLLDSDLSFSALLDLNKVKNKLEGYSDEYISLSFGVNKLIVITRNNVKNIIPHLNVR